ncbi:MAG: hypothetical protein GXP55_19490, partial [Deltaproteobacteria bacterium]|nr:hypothetical protein [Deltaproteobacteria bacterium]
MLPRFRVQTALAALLLVPMACGGAESGVRRVDLAPSVEARPADCRVLFRPAQPVPSSTQALAQLSVHCPYQTDDATTRTLCQENLRRAACETGADLAWDYHFARVVGGMRLNAKVGLAPDLERTRGECAPSCPPGRRCESGYCVQVCDPVCESGFVCESGSCEPICRPLCGDGELCNAERACVPAPEDAGESGDGGASDGGASDGDGG